MNVFQILVAVIVAGILIYLASGFFQPSGQDAFEALKNGIDYAERHDGAAKEAQIAYKADFALNAANFDLPSRSVRLECSSASICGKQKIDVQPRFLVVKEQSLLRTFFRCKNKGLINDCVVYFGEMPAQLGLQSPALAGPSGGMETVTFSATNTGSLDAVDSTYDIGIYSKSEVDGVAKLDLKNEIRGLVKKMVPKEVQNVRHQFDSPREGKYLLRITLDGEDAGRAVWEKDFEIASSVSSGCAALEKGRTTMDGGICRTQYTCTGCESGAECSVRWIEKGLKESDISETYPIGVYVQKPAADGQCG